MAFISYKKARDKRILKFCRGPDQNSKLQIRKYALSQN